MKTLVVVITLFVAALAQAGGSFVGNGAGLMENRFQYGYMSLSKLLMNCLINDDCGLTTQEKKIAETVSEIVLNNVSRADKFVFVTDKQMSDLADLPMNEPHRIAMTGLTPEAPIYINVDMLYDISGKPQLEYGAVVALIFHEAGHQAGETSHQLLDVIGSKLRLKLEAETLVYKFELYNLDKIEVMMNNFSSPNKFAEIRISRNNNAMMSVGSNISKSFRCNGKKAKVTGYEFFNGYFAPIFKGSKATFNFIANIHCVKTNGQLNIERKNVKFDINEDNSIDNLQMANIF
ncbi:MAG: hypothetical protein NDI63_11980 [Pseudobdellovibrio sp.]|nr:hypothetical protein [Pseudobdellovibrio sp.]